MMPFFGAPENQEYSCVGQRFVFDCDARSVRLCIVQVA